MPIQPRSSPEQELSIKERKQELYLERPPAKPSKPRVRPFAVYLRETPPAPLSTEVKTLLWITAILVLLVFVAAIWKIQRRSRPRPRPRPVPTETVWRDHHTVPLCPPILADGRMKRHPI
jgi:hypothetical protein